MNKMTFAEKLARWCQKKQILDCCFYDTATDISYGWGSDFSDPKWIEKPRSIIVKENRKFGNCCGDYKECIECGMIDISKHHIGMTTEGELNHAIHYGTDEKLLKSFNKFLANNGYELYTLGNCYNLIISKQNINSPLFSILNSTTKEIIS